MTSKSPESMPNQASGQERPDFSESDVEKMMNEFQEQQAHEEEKKGEEEGKGGRSAEIESMIEEGLSQAEIQEKERQKRAAAIESMIDEEVEKLPGANLEKSIKNAAKDAVSKIVDKKLGEAMAFADAPDAVEHILINSAVEAVRQAIGAREEYSAKNLLEEGEDPSQTIDPEMALASEEEKAARRKVQDRLRTLVDSMIRANVHIELSDALLKELNQTVLDTEKTKIEKLIDALEQSTGKLADGNAA